MAHDQLIEELVAELRRCVHLLRVLPVRNIISENDIVLVVNTTALADDVLAKCGPVKTISE